MDPGLVEARVDGMTQQAAKPLRDEPTLHGPCSRGQKGEQAAADEHGPDGAERQVAERSSQRGKEQATDQAGDVDPPIERGEPWSRE